jgi:hypothetical protein
MYNIFINTGDILFIECRLFLSRISDKRTQAALKDRRPAFCSSFLYMLSNRKNRLKVNYAQYDEEILGFVHCTLLHTTDTALTGAEVFLKKNFDSA